LGQVAGYAQTAGGWDTSRAFIGTTSGPTLISLPSGWSWSQARGINDSGQVAGSGGPDAFSQQAFIGTTAASTAIPLLPGAYSARAGYFPLNDAGQVVGMSYRIMGPAGVWIWDPEHGTRELNDLVPQEWHVFDPESINDKGQILASGVNSITHYVGPVLLDPVPEPATGVLLAGGLAVLAVLVRRRRPHRRAGSQCA